MAKSKKDSPKVPGSLLARLGHFFWYYVLMTLYLSMLSFFYEAFRSIEKYDYNALPKRTGQTVVLTGGTRGIGLEVLKKLLKLDYSVIFGVRNADAGLKAIEDIRLEGVETGRAKCLSLDLKSLQSVLNFAQNVLQKTDRIDLLINNAGIMFAPYEITEDGFESHFQVNYLSHFLLSQLLLPKMKATASGKDTACRIVNVSCLAHNGASASDMKDVSNPKTYSPYRAYYDSKLCQILATKYHDKIFHVAK